MAEVSRKISLAFHEKDVDGVEDSRKRRCSWRIRAGIKSGGWQTGPQAAETDFLHCGLLLLLVNLLNVNLHASLPTELFGCLVSFFFFFFFFGWEDMTVKQFERQRLEGRSDQVMGKI